VRVERRVDEVDLLPVDPATGSVLLPSAPQARSAAPTCRRSQARWWLPGASLLLAAIAGIYAVSQHRAVVEADGLWAMARAERHRVETVTLDLYRVEQVARRSGPKDLDSVLAGRKATATEAQHRLEAIRSDLRRVPLVDPEADTARDLMVARIDRWVAELGAFRDANRIFLDTDRGDDLVRALEPVRHRWRVPVPPTQLTSRPLPGEAAVARLRLPVDAPIPATLTAIVSSGERLDVDLRTNAVVTNHLKGDVPVTGPSSAFGLRSSGDRLIVMFAGSLATMPAKPSSVVSRGDRPFEGSLVPSSAGHTWIVTYERGSSTARLVDADAMPPSTKAPMAVAIPRDHSLVGATDHDLVLERYRGEGSAGLYLQSTTTGARSVLDPVGGYVLGVGAKAVVRPRYDTMLLIWRGGQVETVSIPEPWSATARVEEAADGTLAVPLIRHQPNTGPLRALGLLRPGSSSMEIVGEDSGSDGQVAWCGNWVFWTVGGYDAGEKAIRAHSLATGVTVPVRLARPLVTFALHDCDTGEG
jgi:hypothetical protein